MSAMTASMLHVREKGEVRLSRCLLHNLVQRADVLGECSTYVC